MPVMGISLDKVYAKVIYYYFSLIAFVGRYFSGPTIKIRVDGKNRETKCVLWRRTYSALHAMLAGFQVFNFQ